MAEACSLLGYDIYRLDVVTIRLRFIASGLAECVGSVYAGPECAEATR